MSNTSTPTTIIPPHPQMAGVLEKIENLRLSLATADPKMPEHLKAIHRTLIQYEELSHLLTEDQIAVVLDGAQRKLGVILAAETTATKPGKGKGLKNVTAEDL